MIHPANRWRTHLDPRDPDYLGPDEPLEVHTTDDDIEPVDLTDAQLDEAALDAENRWSTH